MDMTAGLAGFGLSAPLFWPITEHKSSDQGFSQPFCCVAWFHIATLLQWRRNSVIDSKGGADCQMHFFARQSLQAVNHRRHGNADDG